MRPVVLLLSLSACDMLWGVDEIKQRPDGPLGNDSSIDTALGDASLDDQLIAHYSLDGTSFEDVSGNGHHGNCVACPAAAAEGHLGNAFTFNQHRVDVPGIGLGTPGGFTVSFWVYQTGLDTTNGSCVISKLYGPMATTIQDSWQFCFDGTGKPRFMSHDGTSLNNVGLNGALSQNEWHHIAIAWDGVSRSKQLWIDATLIAAATIPMMFDNGPVIFGADSNLNMSVGWYYGRLDEVRIYSRQLAPDEIKFLAK